MNFFKKKTEPKERTKDPGQLLMKAMDFLKNNGYHILMPGKDPEPVFYMLELNSINGMKRVEFNKNDKNSTINTASWIPKHMRTIKTTVKYTDKNGNKVQKEEMKFYDNFRNKLGFAMWYRHSGYFGKSASTAVLGGRKSRRRKTRRHRKNYL
jgi:hypothetical protein